MSRSRAWRIPTVLLTSLLRLATAREQQSVGGRLGNHSSAPCGRMESDIFSVQERGSGQPLSTAVDPVHPPSTWLYNTYGNVTPWCIRQQVRHLSLLRRSSSLAVAIKPDSSLIAMPAKVRSLLLFQPLLLLHHHLDTIILVYFNTQASHSNAYRPYPTSSSPSSFDSLSTSWLFVLTSLRLSMACTTMSTPSWRLLGSLNSALPAAKFQAFPHPAFCPSTTLVCMEFLHERLDAFEGTHHPPVVRAAGDRYSHHLHDDFRQSPASSLFQLPQRRGSFLECFHSSSGQPWCFRQLHPAAFFYPQDCDRSRIIHTRP